MLKRITYKMNSLLFIVFVSILIVYLQVKQAHTIKQKNFGQKRRPWKISSRFVKGLLPAEQGAAFHENIQLTNKTVPIIMGTPKCAGALTFCENFDLYPYEHIKSLLRKSKVKKILSKPSPFVPRIRVEGEPSACPSKRVVKYPRIGKTRNNTWDFIINQEDYVQAVYIKICSGMKKSCQEEARFGYIAECKQKYASQKLRSPQNNYIVTKIFTMPKDCICAIRRDPSPFARTR